MLQKSWKKVFFNFLLPIRCPEKKTLLKQFFFSKTNHEFAPFDFDVKVLKSRKWQNVILKCELNFFMGIFFYFLSGPTWIGLPQMTKQTWPLPQPGLRKISPWLGQTKKINRRKIQNLVRKKWNLTDSGINQSNLRVHWIHNYGQLCVFVTGVRIKRYAGILSKTTHWIQLTENNSSELKD